LSLFEFERFVIVDTQRVPNHERVPGEISDARESTTDISFQEGEMSPEDAIGRSLIMGKIGVSPTRDGVSPVRLRRDESESDSSFCVSSQSISGRGLLLTTSASDSLRRLNRALSVLDSMIAGDPPDHTAWLKSLISRIDPI
jgi:hypothetical protein